MDGVHDLGGRQGFGPILDKEDDLPFHAEWELRAYGVAQSSAGGRGWSIDWFRHCRELIVPIDYLTRPYFDQWMTLLAAQMIDEGYLTLEELKTGVSTFTPQPADPPSTAAMARAFVAHPKSYALEVAATPRFAVGQAVRGQLSGNVGHTRLPGYVRGRAGVVHAHHGGHIFPDASARGEAEGEHLYTVRFAASELWPEAAPGRDRVYVDLWESYLESA